MDEMMLKATYELLATTTLAWEFVASPDDRNGSLQLRREKSEEGDGPAEAATLSRWARRLWHEAKRDRAPANRDCLTEIARAMFVLRRELHPEPKGAGNASTGGSPIRQAGNCLPAGPPSRAQ